MTDIFRLAISEPCTLVAAMFAATVSYFLLWI